MITATRRSAAVWMLMLLSSVALPACRSHQSNDVEVEVRSVGLDDASRLPVVLLQDKAKRLALPIWIGPAEAQAIAMQLEGINPPRPMTHDLMKAVLEQAGVQLDKVVINDLKNSTYYARILLHSGTKTINLDSRPSDAIALAVRFHKPIFVARSLFKQAATIDLQQQALTAGAVTVAGVTMQPMTEDLAEYFGLPPGHGALVSDVTPDARAALRRGDVVLEVDGEPVKDLKQLQSKLEAIKQGKHAQLSIRRGTADLHVDFSAG
jgi:uncharacterized protein